jgi:hypothetical protein
MSDHDFEKRVKQKMDELKFTPSDAVWQAVELEIRKDRPRRRGWVLIPLLLAGLGVAGYFIFSNSNKSNSDLSINSTQSKQSPQAAELAKPAEAAPGTNDNSSPTKEADNPENTKSPDQSVDSHAPVNSSAIEKTDKTGRIPGPVNPSGTASDRQANEKTENVGNIPVSTGAPMTGKNGEQDKTGDSGLTRTGNTNEVSESLKDPGKPGAKNKKKGNSGIAPVISQGSAVALTNPPVQKQTQQQLQTATKHHSSDLILHDSLAGLTVDADRQKIIQPDSTIAVKSAATAGMQNDSANSETTKLVKSSKKKKGWDWGLNISGGVSNINDGPLTSILKSSHMADAASNSQAAGNSNFLFAPSTAGLPPAKASEVKAGPYFSIGGFVIKQFSKTFSFSAGLQYSQYNTIIEVGYRVDSSRLVNNGAQIMNVARYYRADDNSKFSNKYHFIELPVTLNTRITRSHSLPIFWNAGIHISRMIGSNALVFDSGTGVYYKDKSTLNKTQLGFATGFTFGLFGKSKIPMLIGPSVKYNASEMFNNDILKGNHLISAGLDLRILLNKK